jgi:hypothetical protein
MAIPTIFLPHPIHTRPTAHTHIRPHPNNSFRRALINPYRRKVRTRAQINKGSLLLFFLRLLETMVICLVVRSLIHSR